MKTKILIIVLFFFSIVTITNAQSKLIERIYPPSWWIGMNDPHLQLMVHGDNIANSKVKIVYPGVRITDIQKVSNPNYLFIDLVIDPRTSPGIMNIQFNDSHFSYELNPKEISLDKNQGISSKDFIYLIMPDRFANGDYSNDIISGMNETSLNRDSMFYRHGGDIQGIIDHLDYIKDLGVTAIWCTPEVENNQFVTSYHGYSVTDDYKIDPRLGTNDIYKQYVNKCHKAGIKVIKDVVLNHVGSEHWILKDLPMANWVNIWPEYTTSTYNCEPVMDPYASDIDRRKTVNGWMFKTMPDLNENNSFVQNYLTQNTIWWLEYTGIDGIRFDTYFYNDPNYMIDWATRIKSEFPSITIFAETWVDGIPNQAFFNGGNSVNRGIDTKIDGITDFQFRESLVKMLNVKPSDWLSKLTPNISMNPVYSTLACDFIYKKPNNNVAFLDNHDLSRIYSILGGDEKKLKTAIAILLTTNRIPQMYYGTEIKMSGICDPDGHVRNDFIGGWKEDKANKFLEIGRNKLENGIYNYIKKIANYRKSSPVLQTGKLMQYFPTNNIYVYFRYDKEKAIMVVINSNDFDIEFNALNYQERVQNRRIAKNIITDEENYDLSKLHISANEANIYELN